MKPFLCSSVVAGAALLASTMSIFAQGSLTPPAAPAPTMKTLDQIEARKIVNATNTPGDATNQFIIGASGSYYLTGNITGVSGKNGIQVAADNVTLDLTGFALVGVSGATSGIVVSGTHRNLRVYNGNLQSWPSFGIDATTGINSEFDRMRVTQNSSGGVKCGSGNTLTEISAEGNAGGGIVVGDGCTVSVCSSTANSTGFTSGNDCTFTHNSGVGIKGANDWIVRNSTGANTGGDVVGAGADIGPSEPAQTATHPFANMP